MARDTGRHRCVRTACQKGPWWTRAQYYRRSQRWSVISFRPSAPDRGASIGKLQSSASTLPNDLKVNRWNQFECPTGRGRFSMDMATKSMANSAPRPRHGIGSKATRRPRRNLRTRTIRAARSPFDRKAKKGVHANTVWLGKVCIKPDRMGVVQFRPTQANASGPQFSAVWRSCLAI